jgi:hypothetical protein
MSEPTFFQDSPAAIARGAEVPAANFDNGMNLGGSCAPGVGINMNGGAVVGTPEQFTLLDQGNLADGFTPGARTPQIGQSIGGLPFVDRSSVPWPGSGGTSGVLPESTIRFGDNTSPTYAQKLADPSLDGTILPIANCDLVTLAAGWVSS